MFYLGISSAAGRCVRCLQWMPRSAWKMRRVLFTTSLFIVCSVTLLKVLEGPRQDGESTVPLGRRDSAQRSAGNDDDLACRFPILDPFDQSILSYVNHPKPVVCKMVQPEFTYVDGYFMKVNASLSAEHDFREVQYRDVVRETEASTRYGNWTMWNHTETPSVYLLESVEVSGLYDGDLQYINVHSSVHIDDATIEEKEEQLAGGSGKEANPLSILIFAIDSLSRSNFIRNLPKAFAVLTERMNSTVFRGYTKIDDNTFPNIVAVLTGHKAMLTGHKATIHSSELPGHFQHDHIDHYPFIWKNFSENGYVTGLAEEQPGVFSYAAKGFEHSPTNWYLRPFGQAMDESPLRINSSASCLGNQADAKIILESIQRFLKTRHESGLPYFLFSLLWKMSHDHINTIEMIDQDIANMFREMHDGGYFNSTVIFVMGDHGNRFDSIRKTLIGRYEERMPYLSVYVPPWFRARYPSKVENLNENAWRLSCQFDVYESMVDILRGEYGDEKRQRLKNRGYSLFAPIPKSRTCADAHIQPHFCVCQEEEEVDLKKSKLLRPAVEYALEQINDHFLGQQKYKALCEKLYLDQLLSAQKYKASDYVKHAVRYHWDKLLSDQTVTAVVSNLRVTFSTKPNNGLYEALIQYHEPAGDKHYLSPKLTGAEISRINKYGSDGDCVKEMDKNLGRFCYCKKGQTHD